MYKRQIYQIAESNRNFFGPNWNALASISSFRVLKAYSHVQQPVGGIFACRNGLFDLKSIVERESDGNPLLATRSVISR